MSSKTRQGLLEANFVIAQVGRGFVVVPFEVVIVYNNNGYRYLWHAIPA